MTSANKELINRWFIEIIQNLQLDLIDDVVHPEYRDGPLHKGPTGSEFVKTKFSGMMNLFDAFSIELKDLIEEGNKVCCHYLFTVKIKEVFMGITAPGATYKNSNTMNHFSTI